MSAKRDYYEILGVARDVNADGLKASYRKLAMKYHPDRNAGDADAERKFKEVAEAYEVLKDEPRRAAYDRFGHAAFEGGGRGGARGGFDFSSAFTDVFDDLFGEFMGRGRPGGGQRPTRGQDLRFDLEISLEDAAHGKDAEIRVPASVVCEACEGSGAEPGSKPSACGTCSGYGKVRTTQGFFTVERACPTCGGTGRIVKNPCAVCSGVGLVQKERTLSVRIPRGVEDGTRMRLSSEGEPGLRGGPNGDLYIFLSVTPHPIFKRQGSDLFCRVPISFTTAALGGSIEVPTIDGGRDRIAIPEGAQTGRQFRVKRKGMPGLRGEGTGDLYVECVVETPVNLTRKQKELLRQFDEGATESNQPESEGFFARVKEFWSGSPRE